MCSFWEIVIEMGYIMVVILFFIIIVLMYVWMFGFVGLLNEF